MEKWCSSMEKMVKSFNGHSNFFQGKKVLVTGHTGFKGSWLVLWLNQLGAEVVGYALKPKTNECMFAQINLSGYVESHFDNILDLPRLKSVFKQFQPEIVFHLAAQSLVQYSYTNPIETYQTNVMGSLNVLEAIRSIDSVQSAVMVTTDKCYENKEWVWGYRENDPMGGFDPYSSSKGCAELLISSYRNSYFTSDNKLNQVGLATARAGNVIGGGDWAENRLIPDFVRAIKQGGVVNIRNPNAVRPWQHVLEPLAGYLTLAESLYKQPKEFAQAWNFGPLLEDAKPVKEVADCFVDFWGQSAEWRVEPNEHYPHEAEYLKLDCSKAHSKLNWHPKWNLSKALEKTVAWYQHSEKGEDLFQLCLQQINEYTKE
jgi:CDP-glucose 4,6-dehydratase